MTRLVALTALTALLGAGTAQAHEPDWNTRFDRVVP